MVIAILNQKGGVGKTTLSVNLAAAFAKAGRRVLLVDADTQQSALDWSEMRKAEPIFNVIGIPKKTLHQELKTLSKDFDVVLIDGPPRVNEVAKSAMLAADVVLIPVQPSPYDVWAAHEVVDLLKEAIVFKDSIKYAFMVNRKIVNTAIGRDVVNALSDYEIPVLSSQVCQRVAFAESAATGMTVVETDLAGPAGQEIECLKREVEGLLQ